MMTERILELKMLWLFVATVAAELDCLCGAPPFDNGNPCPACMATRMMEDFGHQLRKKAADSHASAQADKLVV